ncbi:MAG: hypothetical protein KBA51_07375 [Kiritimatiellae bacterium]|nr:hypothetical protein [Kiritimatiellia bacterium]
MAILVLNPIGCAILSVVVSASHIAHVETQLRSPAVYRPVAEAVAVYCQSDQALLPKYLNYAWLPAEIQGLGNPRANIMANGASVELGGGFHHFGYRLFLDDSSGSDHTNVWILSQYSQDSNDRRLTVIALPKSRRFTEQEIVSRVVDGFDRRLALSPKDNETFKDKVLFLMRFGEVEQAQTTCMAWTKVRPAYWMPQSTLAHIRSRLNEPENAERDFAAWVAEHANFPNYIYLFLFHMREGQNAQALAAIHEALAQPFVEPMNSDGNKFYLGLNAAVFAFLQGEYDLALSMCDKMLSDSRKDKWWRRKIWKTRAAILCMKGDQPGAIASMEKADSYAERKRWSALEEDMRHDSALLNAIKTGDRAFVLSYNNWKDNLDSWFNPLDRDGTDIYEPDDSVGLYAGNWNEHEMIPTTPPTVQ